MDAQKAAKVIRRLRRRLGLSQEGLAHLLNATKGAVQHWERGRNKPDLARLLALCRLCPSGPERKELEALVRQAQGEVAPFSGGKVESGLAEAAKVPPRARPIPPHAGEHVRLLRGENSHLERQVARLRALLQRRNEQLRILEDLAVDLQRQIVGFRASQGRKAPAPSSWASPAVG